MNMSKLITRIKMALGIYMFPLPFENPEEMLKDVILTQSLTTFSQYFPHKIQTFISLAEMERVSSTATEVTFKMPKHLLNEDIIAITKLYPTTGADPNIYYGGISQIFNGSDLCQSAMLAQANFDLNSVLTPPFTFNFVHPHFLTIYNWSSYTDILKIEIAYKHSDNLATIKPTMEQAFYDLALLDCKAFLYNNLKFYNEISTTHGNINLRIDEWSNAESEKKDLINNWISTYHLELDAFLVI
jgi:hypothetical protein